MTPAPIERREGRSFGRPTHWYVRTDTKEKVPGVTGLLKDGKPSPALVGWGIKSVAEYAINNWDDLSVMPVAERLKTLKGSPYAERDAAANRGTEVHALAERLVRGEPVEVPDELAGHVEGYAAWLDRFDPEPILTERVCWNLKFGWAGTFDAILRFRDGRVLLCDIKTSRGVYGDVAYQLEMYAACTHYLGDDGGAVPMPAVDGLAVLHVRADGTDMYEIRGDRDRILKEARYIAAVARAVKGCADYIGEPTEEIREQSA